MTATLNTPGCGTQLGTQLDTQPLTEDDMAHADTALILRVLERSGLDQSWLAAECNLSKAYVSRVLSGQYPVPHDMVRRLFHRTSDPSLLELFSGSGGPMRLDAVRRDAVPSDINIDNALPSVMANLAEAAQNFRGGQPGAAGGSIHRAICLLLGTLDTARALASRMPPSQSACVERPNIELLGKPVCKPIDFRA